MKTRTLVFAAAGLAISLAAAACGPAAPDPTTSGPARSTTTSESARTTTTRSSSPHSTTTLPARNATAVDGATISPYTWDRSADAALRIGGGATSTLASLLAPSSSGSAWLIAGTRTSADGHTTATTWTSPDAITWTASPLPGGGPYGEARAATDWNGRTVVVGSVGQGTAQRAAVWISPVPGAPFHQVINTAVFDVPTSATADPTAGGALATGDAGASDPPSVAGAVMDTVTSGTLGLFAAGSMNGRLAFWYSTNGTTWTQLPKADAAVGRSPDATVRQLLETTSGVFAIGSTRSGGATDAALWSSGDGGITWNQVSSPAAFSGDGDHVLSAMATFGGSLVAAGGSRAAGSWSPASWISPNGYNWGPPTESFPEAGGISTDPAGTVVTDLSVSADGAELVAVGGSAAEQRLWTSTDGINWTEAPLPTNAADDADWSATEVATNGATTVIVDSDPGQPRVLVDASTGWQEVSANPATFGPVQTVATPVRLIRDGDRLVMAVTVDQPGQTLGQEQTSTEFLTSENGTRWRRASTFTGETVTDLAATSTGLVAVGGPSAPAVALSTVPTDASVPAFFPAVMWTSPNGAATATHWSTSLLGSGPVVGNSTRAVSTASGAGADTTLPDVQAVTPSGATAGHAASGHADVLAAGQDLGGLGILWTAKDRSGSDASATATTTTESSTTATTTTGSSTTATTTTGSSTTATTATGSSTATSDGVSPASTLDRLPTATNEHVAGACQSTSGAVVVGQETDGAGGITGLIWFRTGSHLTQRGTLLPTPPLTSEEAVNGCTDAGAHLLAWGQTATSSGTPEAAVWVSASAAGSSWKLSDSGALSSGNGTGAITDLALGDGTWLAVAGSAAPSWTAANIRGLAVWRSVNDGKTWQRVITNTSAFDSSFGVSASQVAFVGNTPVLAGQVDGRLALWTGSPAGA